MDEDMQEFLNKPIGIAGLLAASVAGPYLFMSKSDPSASSQTPVASSNGTFANSMGTEFSAGSNTIPAGQLVATNPSRGNSSVDFLSPPQTLGTETPPAIDTEAGIASLGGPIYDFRDVLRFDMTPAMVMQRFPRVTTSLAEVQMDGMRVPFVSGSQPTDVAGSLSYYFDREQRVRRIQMVGTTGDPTLLVTLLTQYYQLKQEQTLGGYLYTTRWNNRVTSVLRLSLAPVIDQKDRYRRYQLFLEINQPSLDYGLSQEAGRFLQSHQGTGRW
jgi:hypothetical protein